MIQFSSSLFINKVDVSVDAASFKQINTSPYLLLESEKIIVPLSCLIKLTDQHDKFDFSEPIFLKSVLGEPIFGSNDIFQINALNGSFNLINLNRLFCYETGNLFITSNSNSILGDGMVRIVLTYFEINP